MYILDNNHLDDLELYQGLRWLDRSHVIGKVQGYAYAPVLSLDAVLTGTKLA